MKQENPYIAKSVQYLQAFKRQDLEILKEFFDEQISVSDSFGLNVSGTANVLLAYTEIFRAHSLIELDIKRVFMGETITEVAIEFSLKLTPISEQMPIFIDGIDVITFSEENLRIRKIRAYVEIIKR